MLRKRLNPPRDLFPIDPWRLEINRFDRRLASELVGPGETAFALSNGYLGMRGNHEEDRPIREAGTYLNGFYEHRPIVYGEHAYGFPKAGQTMLNCPDGKIIKLYVDDEPFDLETAELVSFNRRLEMREGTLRREIVFLTPTGKRIRLASCRLVSFHHRHLAAIRYEIIVEDPEADLVISSEMINRQPLPVQTSDPRMAEGMVGRVLQPAGRLAEGLRAILSFTTSSSGLTFGCGNQVGVELAGRLTIVSTIGPSAVDDATVAHAARRHASLAHPLRRAGDGRPSPAPEARRLGRSPARRPGLGLASDRSESDAAQQHLAAIGANEATACVRQKQHRQARLAGQRLADRTVQPARQPFARMRRQHQQIAGMLVEKIEDAAHGVAIVDIGLHHPNAELVRNCGGRHSLFEQTPAGERVAHAGKGRPIDIAERFLVLGVHEEEATLGDQRQLQTVLEGSFAPAREVGRMQYDAGRAECLASTRSCVPLPPGAE